jgi:hypothetical protein
MERKPNMGCTGLQEQCKSKYRKNSWTLLNTNNHRSENSQTKTNFKYCNKQTNKHFHCEKKQVIARNKRQQMTKHGDNKKNI